MKLIYCKRKISDYEQSNLFRKNKTCAGSSWIIKALWTIHEEIKDQAFPTYLNSHSIRFMIDVRIYILRS